MNNIPIQEAFAIPTNNLSQIHNLIIKIGMNPGNKEIVEKESEKKNLKQRNHLLMMHPSLPISTCPFF